MDSAAEKVKTGLAVVGGVAVAASLYVAVKRLVAHRRDRRLRNKLEELEGTLEAERLKQEALAARLRDAEAFAAAARENAAKGGVAKPMKEAVVRVYIDGCFDMMHFGHSNALRQARAVGTHLVVGLIGDDEIIKNKGSPPVMPFDERLVALQACKFVDEVIQNAPYDLTPDWTRELVNKHNIRYVVHGDDPCISADGNDCYATAKQMGVFKTIKRTEGISTTDIVGRMLLMNREHHIREDASDSAGGAGGGAGAGSGSANTHGRRRSVSIDELSEQLANKKKFLPTSRRIVQFSAGRAAKRDDVVVYCVGAWDLFNAGHIEFLEKARAMGTFLLVGIYNDSLVNKQRGGGFPVLNLHERALSVLQCRHVDEVIIDAPWMVTDDLIKSMNIKYVVQGSVSDAKVLNVAAAAAMPDPYALAKKKGLLREIESPRALTALIILKRIMQKTETYEARYRKKLKGEQEYDENREYVTEQ